MHRPPSYHARCVLANLNKDYKQFLSIGKSRTPSCIFKCIQTGPPFVDNGHLQPSPVAIDAVLVFSNWIHKRPLQLEKPSFEMSVRAAIDDSSYTREAYSTRLTCSFCHLHVLLQHVQEKDTTNLAVSLPAASDQPSCVFRPQVTQWLPLTAKLVHSPESS